MSQPSVQVVRAGGPATQPTRTRSERTVDVIRLSPHWNRSAQMSLWFREVRLDAASTQHVVTPAQTVVPPRHPIRVGGGIVG